MVIDPSCSTDDEQNELADYIYSNKLKPRGVVATHGHFDHIPGVNFVIEEFEVPFIGNREDQFLVDFAPQQAAPFGFHFGEKPPVFNESLSNEEVLVKGDVNLNIFHVPGHSAGSIALYSPEGNFVVVGDVLFNGSIGRTDLPGGNYQTLIESIRTKLLVLPLDTKVLPGHGPETTIRKEKESNPFLV